MQELESNNPSTAPECSCGPKDPVIKKYRRVQAGSMQVSGGREIPVITNSWTLKDFAGAVLVRLGFFRMAYAVEPGIYASGKPDKGSPVLVSANYKLSFDILRAALAGIDAWILVLDTKGVNVWCAAGKGTFGTKELVFRIASTGLSDIISQREVIVPQLGAPGVSAFKVALFSGFKVIFGPVRAQDMRNFLKNGMSADEGMRTVRFVLTDRLTVSLLELSRAAAWAVPAGTALIVALSFNRSGFSMREGLNSSSPFLAAAAAAVMSGTVLTAAFLPYLPGKAFSVKGAAMGLICGILAVFALDTVSLFTFRGFSFILSVSSVSAYLALNLTGASTFTSLSGVRKEVRISVPAIVGALLVSIAAFAAKG